MCDFDACTEGSDCEGSRDSSDVDELDATHHCVECGELTWVGNIDQCDICETYWCRGCFPYGGGRDDLEAIWAGIESEKEFEKRIGEAELFCSDCFKKSKP